MKTWDETASAYNMLSYIFLKYGEGPQATHVFVEVKPCLRRPLLS